MTGRPPIRVLSIPAGHRYVRHALASPGGDVRVLRDPVTPGRPAGVWWPHPGLDPDWLRRHRARLDIVHLHFGFEHRSLEQLRHWLEELRALALPLVFTVHDLVNPHLEGQEAHLARSALLIAHADRLVTLTPGAAAEVEARWGRRPLVLPHPHMVDLERMARPAEPRTALERGRNLRIGIQLGALRANLAARPLLECLLGVLPECPGASVHVRLHDEVRRPGFPRRDLALLRLLERLEARPGFLVSWGGCVAEEALWRQLEGWDALILPYRWATHSGWVEECFDLGTWSIAPRGVGRLSEQAPMLRYRADDAGRPDAESLRLALRRAAERTPPRARVAERRAQREWLVEAHRSLYADLLRR